MKLSELISQELILFPLRSTAKNDILSEMSDFVREHGYASNSNWLLNCLIEREQARHTHMFNMGFPRAVCEGIRKPIVVLGKTSEPVSWQVGMPPVNLIVLYVAPPPKDISFIKGLIQIAGKLNPVTNRAFLSSATNATQLFDVAKTIFVDDF